jgi:predicted MFS family arabinose efflux permease
MSRWLISPEIQVTFLVYVTLFLNFFFVSSFTPLLPRIVDSHGLSDSDLALILSSKSFAHMTASPIIAIIASRVSIELLFSCGVLGVAGVYTIVSFSETLGPLIVARILHGISVATIMVAGIPLLVRAVPPLKRGKYMSFAYSALGHSSLIGPVLSALMYDKLGQLWTFMIPGIATYLCFVLAMSRLWVFRADEGDAALTPKLTFRTMLRTWLDIILTSRSFISMVGIMSAGITFGTLEATLPRMLSDWDGGLPVIEANLIWSVGPLVFTLLSPLIGYVIDKLRPLRVFIFGIFLYAVLYPLFYLMAVSLPGLGTVIGIAFGIEAILETSVYPLVAEIVESSTKTPNALPLGYSLNEIFIQAGFATGDLAGVALMDWKGFKYMGIIIGSWDAFLFLICMIIYYRLS